MVVINSKTKRTLAEILTSKKQFIQEPKYNLNPLKIKIGSTVNFEGINLNVKNITCHINYVDYHLNEFNVNFKLRLIQNPNTYGHKIQLLFLFDQKIYEKKLHHFLISSDKFFITHSDDKVKLEEPKIYWKTNIINQNCWEFNRMTEGADGEEIRDEMVIEFSKNIFSFFRGVKFNLNKIIVS
jgi:hypothetical protein